MDEEIEGETFLARVHPVVSLFSRAMHIAKFEGERFAAERKSRRYLN